MTSARELDGTNEQRVTLRDVVAPLIQHWRQLLIVPLLIGLAALGGTFMLRPVFTATTTFIPPQQQQSTAASALASLGAVAGLMGGGGVIRSPAEQYISLLSSTSVRDHLIDRFDLMRVYAAAYRFEARRKLGERVRVHLGKKDGLISIEVDDVDPARAADLANGHVEELRRLTGALALTEAQHRRLFFEAQLQQTRDRLAAAQRALEGGGFTAGALRAEPKAAAEGYARLQAEVTAAEVRLQTLRRGLADATPEVQQQQTLLAALRAQLARLERVNLPVGENDYVGRYREFKYQETLFELFARQFELARLDESREGALIQVVDAATPPEWKSRPKRALTAVIATLTALVILVAFLVGRHLWRLSERATSATSEVAARAARGAT